MGSKVPPTMANSLFTATIINPGQYEELNKAIMRELQGLEAQTPVERLEVHVDFH